MNVNLPEGRIGVAVSGGIDSMVLLHLIMQKGKNEITVINIDHGIRGAESKADSDFVASYCNENSLKLLHYTIDTLAESKKTKQSIELCARTLRYQIFYGLLNENQVDYIALAHHADDNAETILMRIARGTGLKGLKGIYDHDGFIHPLLDYSKQEIENYASQNEIPFVTDSTNLEDDYTRNFIRNNTLKSLKERFFNLHRSFNRLAQSAMEADEYIMSKTLNIHHNSDSYYLALDDFLSAHDIIKKYTLRKLFTCMGICQDIEARHYEYIKELSAMENNAVINLPFNISATKQYDKLCFYVAKDLEQFCQKVDYNKTYVFAGYKYCFIKAHKVTKGISFDPFKIPKEAVIRTRKDGDFFKRYGGGTKKLNDYLTDIKMPARERDRLLVIARDNEILMICGHEISEKIKIDEKTKEILYIKKEIL